jgi:UDP-2,3-diacylglucosamine hydrolase
MFPNIHVQEGALFIADAHESSTRTLFWDFLLLIKEKPPVQLFLMGDMFDLLVGGVEHGVQKYRRYIDLIDELATRCDVFYFEGNHDFNLSKLFLHVKVIPIEEQPVKCFLPNAQSMLLLHGDKYGDGVHRCYTRLIRSPLILKILNGIDVFLHGAISKKIESNQQKKQLCRPIEGFEERIQNKLSHYPDADWIAEGHYHQNRTFHFDSLSYINFSSFACNQSYFSVQSSSETHFAAVQLRSCPSK